MNVALFAIDANSFYSCFKTCLVWLIVLKHVPCLVVLKYVPSLVNCFKTCASFGCFKTCLG